MNASTRNGIIYTDDGNTRTGIPGLPQVNLSNNIEPTWTFLLYYCIVLRCSMYAAATSIFYKKSFNRDMFPTMITFLYLGLFADHFGQSHPVITVTCLCVICARMVLTYPASYYNTAWLFMVILLVLVDVSVGFEFPGSYYIPYKTRIVITALVQFIRKPTALKAKLQGIRSKFGPLYVMYVTLHCLDIIQHRDIGVVFKALAAIAITSSIVAGFMFRPDNKTVTELFNPGSTLSSRRYYHARFMIISFVCNLLLFVCV